MARDGSGTYNRPVADYASGNTISSTDMNSEMDQIAAALTASIAKDGQTNPTADLPMASYNHTGVGNASARDHYAAAGQVQDSAFIWCGTAGGTKNALTLAPSPTVTAYATGQRFVFKVGSTASDDATTVAVSGLATKAVEIDDTALSASLTLEANKYYSIIYDGTAFQASRLSSDTTSNLVSGDIGTTVQGYDADTLKADTADQLTVGFTAALDDDGTQTTGTYTPDPDTGNYKKIVNGGAFTLGEPAPASGEAVSVVVLIVNNGSAGSITTSAYDKVTGESFNTTNTERFLCSINVFNYGGTIVSHLDVVALDQ